MRCLWVTLFWVIPSFLGATFFANPAQPALQTSGILDSPREWYCLRIGYVADYVYLQKYDDEFPQITSVTSHVQMKTDASLLTLNVRDVVDFDVVIGSSQIQVDREVFAKRQFSWAAGTKFIFYSTDWLWLSADCKYFESKQRPYYFLSEGYAFDVCSKAQLYYYEVQAAVGFAIRATCFYPYFYATYIYSKIDPYPLMIVVRYPFSNQTFDTPLRSVMDQQPWGIALGTTLLAGSQGSLTVEARFFNQNGATVTGEVRF